MQTVKKNKFSQVSGYTVFVFGGLLILLFLAVIAGISCGSTNVSPATVLRVLAAKIFLLDASNLNETNLTVVWLIRTPRVLTAAFVGAGLAVAGAQMQGLFKNPLASPDILGTSAGGSFGAVLAIAFGLAARSIFYLPLFAFLGALIALFALYAIATQHGKTPVATLLLSGVALNALIGAMTSFVISANFVNYQVSQEVLFWLMGGLDNRTWTHVLIVAPCALTGIAVALFYLRELDILLLGEETATSLGVEIEQTKLIILTNTALLTGAAVAVSGVLGFVGLIIPHVVRLVLGSTHRRLIPASALLGASFLISADLLARTILRPEEMRLGIITAFCGAPFFLYLLLRHRKDSAKI